MKKKRSRPVKVSVTVRRQTPDEQRQFETALDRLLAALVRQVLKGQGEGNHEQNEV